MLNTIIFDLGGVLIDWNPDYVYDHIFTDPERRAYFFSHICTPDWNEEQDAGRSLKDATDLLLVQHPEWEHEIRAYYGRWKEMLGGPIEETVDILRKIKNSSQYRLYALTNWSAETFPIALELYDFLHWFDGIVVSGTEKTRKPFPEFYNILFNRYHVEPLKAVFIDDNLRNIEAARALGMTSIHFSSAGELEAALQESGVLA